MTNFLFVSIEALSTDLAWQLSKAGHSVKFFTRSQSEKDVGDGFVEKVDAWEPHKDWADVIVFDDIGFGDLAERLRAEGKHVVGGSAYTDRLENDREFGQTELRGAGVATLNSWNFSSFDEAIEFVKKNPERYVVKPSGNAQNEKELLFVGEEADGKDVVRVLEHYKLKWSNKIKFFQIQKFESGVEVGIGAFFNGKDFVYPININFEHKRLFPKNIGPSTGEMGCYDDKTEVLTRDGWKLFKDLSLEDEICTLDPATRSIEYGRPDALVSFDNHRRLLSIQNRDLDLVVTKDHNVLVESELGDGHRPRFVKARDLVPGSGIPRTGVWVGRASRTFVLPSLTVSSVEGGQVQLREAAPLEVPMDDWLAFIGLWLSNGTVSSAPGGRAVSVSLDGAAGTSGVEELLSSLPFGFTKEGSGFRCRDEQLVSYLERCSAASGMRAPSFIGELGPSQISTFLDWLRPRGVPGGEQPRRFRTSSKVLADQIQELLLKTGRVGLVARGRSGDVPGESPWERFEVEVVEGTKSLQSKVDQRDVSEVDYSGRVYCASVKNHVMYVRRNGKPCWCGNTAMYWTKDTPLFENTLLKTKEKLAASKYVGYIDLNCIANSKGIFPLEWTSRFGYPTISIQMEGVTSEWGAFLSEIAQGKDAQLKTKKGYQVGVVVAIPPFPFEDDKAFRKYSEDATILFKRPSLTGLHIGEAKLVEGDWRVAGRSGYVLVVTGSGPSMQDAIDDAYQAVRNVMVPNMFYRDDIGQRWFKDVDLLLSWGYL